MSMPRARSANAGPDAPATHPRRRPILAGLAATAVAVLTGAGLALVGAAAPAAAHHNTITATAVCADPTTGLYDVTWTIVNSERDKAETIIVSSDEELVPIGTKIAAGGTHTAVQENVAAAEYTLSLRGKWSNGRENPDSGTIKKSTFDATPCTTPPPTTPPPTTPPTTPPPTTPPATEPPQEASLAGSFLAGTCEANAPYITYEVKLIDPDGQSTSRLATLTLSDGAENSYDLELGEIPESGVLTGKKLWPGAVVVDGVAVAWPGWQQIDGEWVETPDNYGWTRSLTEATITVNPSIEVALAYPPATPLCSGPPTGGGDGDVPLANTGGGTGNAPLASTGFEGAAIAIGAAVVTVIGAGLLVFARLRRRV